MSKEEKKNVLIAVALSIAAVVVIFLWGKHGTTLAASGNGTSPIVPNVGMSSPPSPSYVNYNIPAYQALPPQVIGQQQIQPLSQGNNGGGCCNSCGYSGSIENGSVNQFNSLI